MPSLRPEDLTPFGRIALKLDRELSDLARAGEEMATVNLESDRGLDEGLKILQRVALGGETLNSVMQEFAASLQETRDKAEAAMKLVAGRAQVIQERRQRENELQERLDALKQTVKEAGATLAEAAQPGRLDEAGKRRIKEQLEAVQAPLARCVADAQALKAEANGGRFARVERQADAMIDSLNATRRKIEQAVKAP
jgi:hypothetical protein